MSKCALPVRTFVAIALVFAVSSFFAPDKARAYRCISVTTPEQMFKRSFLIFRGEVVRFRRIKVTFKLPDGVEVTGPVREATFRVKEVWKGSLIKGDRVDVRDRGPITAPAFWAGYKRIMAAYLGKDGRFYTHQCTLYGAWNDPDRYIRAFEKYAKKQKRN